MFERSSAWLLFLVLLGVAAPLPVRAQGAAASPSGSARLDSLLAELRAARDAYMAVADGLRAKEAAARSETLDSARVGPFLLVARPAELPRARRAFAAAWRRMRPLLGGAELPATAFLVSLSDPPPDFAALARRPRHFGVWLVPELGSGPERSAVRAIGGALVSALPPEAVTWLEGAAPGSSAASEVFRELVTSPAEAARGCAAGEPSDCAAALALEPAGPGWSRWYTPAQLRQVVAVHARGRVDAAARACARGADAACLAYLAEHAGPPPPVGAAARASFLEHLLRTGAARGAFAALQHARGDVAGQLAAASIDGSLARELGAWRAHVLGARPQAHAGLPAAGGLTLVWVALLFALALRSTRWRLG